MADKAPFERKQLICPKCQSPNMLIQDLREMFENPHPPQMPLYNATVKQRIVCGDCGAVVWPVPKVVAPGKPEKGKK